MQNWLPPEDQITTDAMRVLGDHLLAQDQKMSVVAAALKRAADTTDSVKRSLEDAKNYNEWLFKENEKLKAQLAAPQKAE